MILLFCLCATRSFIQEKVAALEATRKKKGLKFTTLTNSLSITSSSHLYSARSLVDYPSLLFLEL